MRTTPKYIIVHYTDDNGDFVTRAAVEQSPWWEMVDEPDFTHHYVVIDGSHMDTLVSLANSGDLLDEAEREERSRKQREEKAKETVNYWEHKRRGEEERIKYNELRKEAKNANT
jgi:hypothetical protein